MMRNKGIRVDPMRFALIELLIQFRKRNERERSRQTKDEDTQFDAQLDEIGARVIGMKADGNCLFRSLADQVSVFAKLSKSRKHNQLTKHIFEYQVEGAAESHWRYRQRIISYIEDHREV